MINEEARLILWREHTKPKGRKLVIDIGGEVLQKLVIG